MEHVSLGHMTNYERHSLVILIISKSGEKKIHSCFFRAAWRGRLASFWFFLFAFVPGDLI